MFFFLYFDCRAQASDTSESTHTLCWNWSQSQHSAKILFWHFNVKYSEKRNNSSTTSLVQHHAQPVEEHACSMRMRGTVGYLRSAVYLHCHGFFYLPVWMYVCLITSVVSFTVNEQICGFISFAQHHEDSPTCPIYSTTHNALHS